MRMSRLTRAHNPSVRQFNLLIVFRLRNDCLKIWHACPGRGASGHDETYGRKADLPPELSADAGSSGETCEQSRKGFAPSCSQL